MNNPAFGNGEYYHVYNRGADKRQTFLDVDDYWRFIHGMPDFNDANPAIHPRDRVAEVQPRRPVVQVAAFCLMPNHFHMLVRQLHDGGITLFMRKLSTGYTMYFNKRYERSGVLFQGRYKAKHVADQQYLAHLTHYIHANPIAHATSAEVEPPQSSKVLDAYPWSSWHTYNGLERFEGLTDIGETLELVGSDYRTTFDGWLSDRSIEPLEATSLHIDR